MFVKTYLKRTLIHRVKFFSWIFFQSTAQWYSDEYARSVLDQLEPYVEHKDESINGTDRLSKY